MTSHTHKTRAQFRALKRITADTIFKVDAMELAAFEQGDDDTRQKLFTARSALEANIREIGRAEAAFLLSNQSLASLTSELVSQRKQAQRALDQMTNVNKAIQKANLIAQILAGLVTLVA